MTVRRQPQSENEVSAGVALFQTLKSLGKVSILWLSLDDMDYMRGDALSMMKSAMEEDLRKPMGLRSSDVVGCDSGPPFVGATPRLPHPEDILTSARKPDKLGAGTLRVERFRLHDLTILKYFDNEGRGRGLRGRRGGVPHDGGNPRGAPAQLGAALL